MSASKIRFDLFHILFIRWFTLFLVAILYLLGSRIGSPVILVGVCIYNWLLTLYWRHVNRAIQKMPLLILVDITLAIALVTVTDRHWTSPYFAYLLSCNMTIALALGWRYGMLSAAYICSLSIVGLLLDKQALSDIARFKTYGLLANSYVALFLTAFFMGYPTYIIQQIKKTEADISHINSNLEAAEQFLAVTGIDNMSLSEREQQILRSLATGKTNAQIADELYISEITVKNHLYRIYKKLGVSSREEATIYFHSVLADSLS